jgi:threonine dehydrogenase-like Zn-dependent dehydrogenase
MKGDDLVVLRGNEAPMRALVLAADHRRGRSPRPPVLAARDIPRPAPPAPGWVLVRPSLAGIASDDLALLRAEDGATRPGASPRLPFVPGREVIGHVEAARGTTWAREGQRVIVEPNAGCTVRGFPTCGRCLAGDIDLCENRDRPSPIGEGADGGVAGGGGWSEGILVAEEMLVPADGISDQRGVLGVALATAIHAVLRWPRRGDSVVVIGSGTTTRLLVAALRRLHPEVDVTVVLDSRGPRRSGRRRRRLPAHLGVDETAISAAFGTLGASRVWRGSPEGVVDNAAELVGARRLRPPSGTLALLDRGVDAVFDCRGTAASVDLGLHLLRSGGSLILAGRAARLATDWSAVSTRQLSVMGSAGFGQEPAGWRTFAAVREWLVDESFPVDGLVTHRYPLDSFATAIATAAGGEAMGAVKVVFEGPGAPLRERTDRSRSERSVDEPATPVLLASTAARVRRGGVAGD